MVVEMPIRVTAKDSSIESIKLYVDTLTSSEPTGDSTHNLNLFDEPVRDNALRGEDYPALVRVWDNDVDAAIYDSD